MRKLFITLAMVVSVSLMGQDVMPQKARQDKKIVLKDDVNVHRAGTEYTKNTYTEIYEVLTDSMVYRFGMVYSKDSIFIKREQRDGINRKFYDQMQRDIQETIANQERHRKETEEFLNSYRASYEVWSYFKLLGILKW